MKMEIAFVANFPRASLSFDLTADNNALQLNMEEFKVCLPANIKIEEREEKGEVCDITYFESGHEETLDYSVTVYGFEIRYLGRTKLVEVGDGFSQFRTLKPDTCASNESHLSSVFRLEIEGIIQKKEYLCRKSLLTLKGEVIVTSKFARHLLPKQLMPYEPLSDAWISSPKFADEFFYNKDGYIMSGINLEESGCFEFVDPLTTAVSSSPQSTQELINKKLPEDEDAMNGNPVKEAIGGFMEEGLGTLNKGKTSDKEFLTKNGEKNENTSERSCKAAESYKDCPFFHHKLIWLVLQFLIAVIIKIIIGYFSLMTHSMRHALVPIALVVLVVSRSYGELCIPEAALEVGNITLLRPCEPCDINKLNCQGNTVPVCLNIFPTTQFAVGCAPNICINDGCPEWNGGNGSYKIQYRNGECGSACPGHFSLAEWMKNCTISPPPSFGANCLITTTGENGPDQVAIIIASFSVVAGGIVVGLLILWKKKLLCFKNIGHSKKNEPEGERLRNNIQKVDGLIDICCLCKRTYEM